MVKARYTAAAQDLTHRVHVRPSGIGIGDKIRISISTKWIEHTAEEASVEHMVRGLADAWNGSPIPEFSEITADVAQDDSGFYLRLEHDTPGVDFSVQITTSNADDESSVTETVAGTAFRNEVQRISLDGDYSSGNFTLSNDFGSGVETTASIPFDATAAQVRLAIEGLASVDPGDVSVTGEDGGPWFVEWRGNYAAVEVPEFTVNDVDLAGTNSVTVATVQHGYGGADTVYLISTVRGNNTQAGTLTISLDGQTTGNVAFDAAPGTVQSAIEALANVSPGDVAVYGYKSVHTQIKGSVWVVHLKGNFAGINKTIVVNSLNLVWDAQVQKLVSGGSTSWPEIKVVDYGGTTSTPSNQTWRISRDGSGTVHSIGGQVLEPDGSGGFVPRAWGHIVKPFAFGAYDPGDFVSADVLSLFQLYGFAHNSGSISVLQFTSGNGFVAVFDGPTALGIDHPDMHISSAGVSVPLARAASVATVIDGGAGSQNEIQSIVVGGSGGTFDLEFAGQPAAAISYGETAANVEAALEALSTIGSGNVSVGGAGTAASPYLVEFVGALASTNVSQIIGDGTNLTGGSGTCVEFVAHSTGANEQQTVTLDPSVLSGTFRLGFAGQFTAAIAYDADATAVENALEALSTIPGVSVAGPAGGPWVVTFDTNPLSGVDVPLMAFDGNGLVLGPGSEFASVVVAQHATGREWWNNPDNWDTRVVPEYDDEANVDQGQIGPRRGLRQWSTFTVNPTTDVLSLDGADFVENQRVRVITTGTLPDGLDDEDDYYVKNWDPVTQTCQLSETPGGAAVDTIDAGTGTHVVGVRLAYYRQTAQFLGDVGLPEVNADLGYYEYRNTELRIGAAVFHIGQGGQGGSPRTRINAGPWPVTLVMVQGTGEPQDNEAALVVNGAAITELAFSEGNLALAPKARQVCNVATVRQGYEVNQSSDTTLLIGPDAAVTTLIKAGGRADCNAPLSTLRHSGGDLSFNGSGALGQLFVQGGDVHYNSIGALGGNTVVSGDGHLDFSQDLRPKTVSNPIEMYGPESRLSDPHKVVSSLVLDLNETVNRSNLSIGQDIRLTRGSVA